jgi:hypothetical protein
LIKERGRIFALLSFVSFSKLVILVYTGQPVENNTAYTRYSFALNFRSGVDYDLTFLKAFVAANNLGFKVVFSFNYVGNSPFMKDTVIETLCFWTPYNMYYHF